MNDTIETTPSSTSATISPMAENRSAFSAFVVNLFAGGVSGIAAKTAAAPLDRIKLLMQTQKINRAIIKPYTSSWNCAVRVYAEEGLSSFWRGNLANVYRYFPSQALNFAFKDQFKGFFVLDSFHTDEKYGKMKVAIGNLLSGGFAGGTALIICYPFDMARTRLATDSGSAPASSSSNGASAGSQTRRYVGTWDCLRQAYKTQGITGLYGGLGVALTGAVIFRAMFMGGYDFLKYHYKLDQPHRSQEGSDNSDSYSVGGNLASRWLAAQAVTTFVGTACYPLDTVKRRMMVQGETSLKSGGRVTELPYKSAWHCFTSIVRKEGVRSIFAGYGANLLRGFSGPILLVGYDEVKRLFHI